MPWSLERFQNAGHLHFITFSCRRREPRLASPAARSHFEQLLEAARIRSGAAIYGYVVMPEHVHLLLNEPAIHSLARTMQGLKQASAHFLKTGAGSFWEPRYYDFNVFTDRKRIEKLRYIHRNPVRRGLVRDPADWPWSSYRSWLTGERRTVRLVFQ